MFKLVRKSYYKTIISMRKFMNSLYTDQMEKLIDKEPSLYTISDVEMLNNRGYIYHLISNPNIDKVELTNFLLKKFAGREQEFKNLVKNSFISKNQIMMKRLVSRA